MTIFNPQMESYILSHKLKISDKIKYLTDCLVSRKGLSRSPRPDHVILSIDSLYGKLVIYLLFSGVSLALDQDHSKTLQC